jgi:hypothetical protein
MLMLPKNTLDTLAALSTILTFLFAAARTARKVTAAAPKWLKDAFSHLPRSPTARRRQRGRR